VPGPCSRSVAHHRSAGMLADQKPWMQHGDPPYDKCFGDRIWKASSGHRGSGMKFDGDCRACSDQAGVLRGDLRAMYQECARGNPDQGPPAIALAVLQRDVQCGAMFGTDEKGARAFNVWVSSNRHQPVVGKHAIKKLQAQLRKPISETRREDAWHYWHEIVLFPSALGIPASVRQAIFTHPHRSFFSVWTSGRYAAVCAQLT